MGQCSTLPAKRDKNPVRSSTSSSQSSSYQYREQREAYDDNSRRHLDGDVVMGQYSQSNRNYDQFMDDGTSNSYHTAASSKSTKRRSLDPVHEFHYEDFFPAPALPDGAKRTRCYRLNLDVPVALSPTHDALGPFFYNTPDHLVPKTVSLDDDMEEEKTDTQLAIDTARIFRGIKVDLNGNIVGRNERSSRSRGKGQTSAKTAENSRQSAKIYKANDLVDEMVAGGGDENGGDKPNMLCIFPMGEYDDLKQMVRDGSKKLREAEGFGDEQLLAQNTHRLNSPTRYATAPQLMSPPPSSVSRRSSNDQSVMSYHSSASRHRNGTSGSGSLKIRPSPRDHSSSRRSSASSNRGGNSGHSDWSESFNFNAFWNCGGAGKTSPVNLPPDVYSRRYRSEGRNESSRFSRGGSMSERDAPIMH